MQTNTSMQWNLTLTRIAIPFILDYSHLSYQHQQHELRLLTPVVWFDFPHAYLETSSTLTS
jgi:hypothetical protein